MTFLNCNRKKMVLNHSPLGLTLLELIVAIAILGVIAAIAIPGYISYRHKAKLNAAIADLQRLELEIEEYVYNIGALPDKLLDLGINAITDPWGRPYHYLRIDGGTTPGIEGKRRRDKNANPVNSDYDLYSMGEDGVTVAQFTAKNARDDVVRANDGAYFGLAEDH
jgi:general secretion pathway protein G